MPHFPFLCLIMAASPALAWSVEADVNYTSELKRLIDPAQFRMVGWHNRGGSPSQASEEIYGTTFYTFKTSNTPDPTPTLRVYYDRRLLSDASFVSKTWLCDGFTIAVVVIFASTTDYGRLVRVRSPRSPRSPRSLSRSPSESSTPLKRVHEQPPFSLEAVDGDDCRALGDQLVRRWPPSEFRHWSCQVDMSAALDST